MTPHQTHPQHYATLVTPFLVLVHLHTLPHHTHNTSTTHHTTNTHPTRQALAHRTTPTHTTPHWSDLSHLSSFLSTCTLYHLHHTHNPTLQYTTMHPTTPGHTTSTHPQYIITLVTPLHSTYACS